MLHKDRENFEQVILKVSEDIHVKRCRLQALSMIISMKMDLII